MEQSQIADVKLTRQETRVFNLLLEGKLNKQIASDMSCSFSNVKVLTSRILKKFDVSSRVELLVHLLKEGKVVMKDISITSSLDDGHGREYNYKIYGPKCVTLNRKEDWKEVKEPGDYAWSTWAESFESLVLVCPFCGFEAPMPWLIKINCKDPLDIAQELYCKKCCTFFCIVKGVAYRSWIPLEELKKCL